MSTGFLLTVRTQCVFNSRGLTPPSVFCHPFGVGVRIGLLSPGVTPPSVFYHPFGVGFTS